MVNLTIDVVVACLGIFFALLILPHWYSTTQDDVFSIPAGRHEFSFELSEKMQEKCKSDPSLSICDVSVEEKFVTLQLAENKTITLQVFEGVNKNCK